MRSSCEFLTCDAAPHDVFCVFHGGRPIKPCSKSFVHEHSTARMVPTGALVDFEQYSFAIFFVDAFLEYLGDAALV